MTDGAVNDGAAAGMSPDGAAGTALTSRVPPTDRPRSTDGWAEVFGALADGNRLRLLVAVHHRPGSNVTELAETVGMSANATSHALAGLRMRGIVRSEPAGRERRWWVVSDDVHQLLHFVGATHAHDPNGPATRPA